MPCWYQANSLPNAERQANGQNEKNSEPMIDDEALSVVDELNPTNYLPECKKQQHNLQQVLQFSNATPFRDRYENGYLCAFCNETFQDPKNLRLHTHNQHNEEKKQYKAGLSLRNYVVFLDIDNLKCMVCEEEMLSLKKLLTHLIDYHNIIFYEDIDDYLQPYKLTEDVKLVCCLCQKSFNSLKLVIQHMNYHFNNFICSICGVGFVNKCRLIKHMHNHERKVTLDCKYCKETFVKESKRRQHENDVHMKVAGRNKCQICYERFANYYQKSRHMVTVHNTGKIKCNACDKEFVARTMLAIHVRRDHLLERSYECKVCKHSFFLKKRLEEHYLVHTKEKSYKCEICDKCFSWKKNLGVHMKTHIKPIKNHR